MDLPPLKTLPAFEAVARLNSFSRAAEELSLTQSAISHQIRQLENDLGEPLFNRAGRTLSLTDAGEQFLEVVTSALRQIERASNNLRGTPDNQLRLAVPSSLAVCWLIPRLPNLQRKYPQLELTLEMQSDMPVLSERIGDAFLTVRDRQRGYQFDHLYTERLFAICSRRLWREIRESLQARGLTHEREPREVLPEWLAGFPLLSATSLFEAKGEDWRRFFAATGVKPPENVRVQHFSHLLLAHEAARHHQGIALSNDYMLDTATDPDLVVIPAPSFPTGDAFYLAYKHARRNEPAIRRLTGWLIEQAARSGWRANAK